MAYLIGPFSPKMFRAEGRYMSVYDMVSDNYCFFVKYCISTAEYT